MNSNRVRKVNNNPELSGNIIYWMSREQRVQDNWALIYAYNKAIKEKKKFGVVFCLVPEFLEATIRQYDFLLKGLEIVNNKLDKLNIPFYLLLGSPETVLSDFIIKNNITELITDFDPLKIKRKWKNELFKRNNINFYEIDSHNIVPCWIASDKQEFGAYTLRPKIKKLLENFLDEFPTLTPLPEELKLGFSEFDLNNAYNSLKVNTDVKPIDWLKPGEDEAEKILKLFLQSKLNKYNELRNDPNLDVQSNLSPYLHFGHISAQKIVLEVKKNFDEKISEAFLEELIIRKELSDNYCFYNKNYDNINGMPEWAKTSLYQHISDKREIIYSLEEFEQARTNDPLWNAAQKQMVSTGKMHGYMRMYWAKKILEWTENPEIALSYAIYLNDKYELDGRDPNGYTGIMWSIGGVHDRPWFDRPVFGKIRYMNYNGCARKFNVIEYINRYS